MADSRQTVSFNEQTFKTRDDIETGKKKKSLLQDNQSAAGVRCTVTVAVHSDVSDNHSRQQSTG